ncbi:MAG: hypothetical protein O3B19_11000, partial [Actinomycetota bacterium]|nr:hypothetical protein [Actinomycetota bacterium]
MLLAALALGVVGVVQRSVEPKADAETLSLGAISAQMRNHQGTEGSNEANCIRYAPPGSVTSSDTVVSPDEALAAHGWTESCPGSLDLDQQSAVGITPVASGDFTNGESFLLAEVTHYNRRVEGNGAEFYDGVARLGFGDFDGDPSIDLSWELWETTNTSGMGQGQCRIRGPQGGEAPCVDRVVFTIPDEVAMTKDGRSYRLTIDKVTAVEGDKSCRAVPVVEVMVDDHEEDEHEEEGNTILTAEGMERRGCVYGTVMQGSAVTIVKAIEGVDTDVVAPSTMFVIDSSATPTDSSWNGISFELTPPDDGSASTDPKIWSSGEMVTLTEQDPMNPRWELTDITCTGTTNYEVDLETRELTLGKEMKTANGVEDGPITCTFTNTYVNEMEREEISLAKVPSPMWFSAAGQTITYAYTISNTGNQPLGPGQFTVTDDRLDAGVAFNCGAATVELDPTETVSCSRTYTTTAADVTASAITNIAFASLGELDSATVSATVDYADLLIAKSASPTQVSAAGQSVTYTYTLTNNGTEPLGPDQFTVTDDKINSGTAFNCGAAATTLAVDGTLSCTATYTVTAADITAGSIVNKASASGGG